MSIKTGIPKEYVDVLIERNSRKDLEESLNIIMSTKKATDTIMIDLKGNKSIERGLINALVEISATLGIPLYSDPRFEFSLRLSWLENTGDTNTSYFLKIKREVLEVLTQLLAEISKQHQEYEKRMIETIKKNEALENAGRIEAF